MAKKFRPTTDPVQKLNEYTHKMDEHSTRIQQASFDQPKPLLPQQPTSYDASIWAFAIMKVNNQWFFYKDDHELLRGDNEVECLQDRDPQGRVINTYEGNDIITGSHYDDIIYAGDGNDQLEGGGGINRLYGGEGNDRYVFKGIGTQIISDCSGYNVIYYPDHAIDSTYFVLHERKEDNQAIYCAYESLSACVTQHSPAVIINGWNNPDCKVEQVLNDTHITTHGSFKGLEGCWTFEEFKKRIEDLKEAHHEL